MRLPNINIKELEKIKEDNFKDRLKFIEKYADWVKNNSIKKWSSEQKNLVE